MADFIQFVVLTTAVIVLLFLVFGKVGGIGNFISQAPESFFNLTCEKYNWFYVGLMCVIGFLNYSTSWALVQRYYSVDSDKNARKVGYLVALLNVIGPLIFFVPAMVAVKIIPNVQDFNKVYPLICKTVLPIGMLGMVIACRNVCCYYVNAGRRFQRCGIGSD